MPSSPAASSPILDIRKADSRGSTDLGWLHSRHSFSFGRYHDPKRMSFRSLRVLNDDIVEPGAGFGEHGHDNMEIISWVLDGALAHKDSTGTSGVIQPGDLQVMAAGRGIRHSEQNASATQRVHFFQIWIEPAVRNVEAAYQQKMFAPDGRRNHWQLVISANGRGESLTINQDALMWIADVDAEQHVSLMLDEQRFGYMHIAFGNVRIGEQKLESGDAITLIGPAALDIEAVDASQVLLFDVV